LGWVGSQQVGPDGVALVLAGLVLIAFAAWFHHGARAASPRWRRVALPLALACVAAAGAVGPRGGGTLFASPARPRRWRSARSRAERSSPRRARHRQPPPRVRSGSPSPRSRWPVLAAQGHPALSHAH